MSSTIQVVHSSSSKELRRISGLHPPYSYSCLLTLFAYLLTTALHYFLLFGGVEGEVVKYILVAASVLTTAVIVITWIYTVQCDPIVEGNEISPSFSCFGHPVIKTTRYCPDCRKTVFEMDHHCSYLNNCIGGKNYRSFFILVISATLQMIESIVIDILLLSYSRDFNCLERALRSQRVVFITWIVIIIHLALSIAQAVMFLTLTLFHSYLCCCKYSGTFDWLIDRKNGMYRRRHPYGVGEDSTSSSKHPDAILADLRQKEREEFERTLFTGKKNINDSFRSNASQVSDRPFEVLSRMMSGPSYQWDDIESSRGNKSMGSDPSSRPHSPFHHSNSKSGREISSNVRNDQPVEVGGYNPTTRLATTGRSASGIPIIRVDSNRESSNSSYHPMEGEKEDGSEGEDDDTAHQTSSDGETEQIQNKRKIKKSDLLLKRTLTKGTKVIPLSSNTSEEDEATFSNPDLIYGTVAVDRRDVTNRASVTMNYFLNTTTPPSKPKKDEFVHDHNYDSDNSENHGNS
eukprot:gene8764-9666_t